MSFQETFSQVSVLCRLAEKAALFVLRASGLKSMAVARRHTCNCKQQCFVSVCTGNEITMLKEREAIYLFCHCKGCQHASCFYILEIVRVALESVRALTSLIAFYVNLACDSNI